jgi:SET domain-containing protein
MFYFKTTLKESPNHGIGIFADEDIPINTLIWSPSPALSLHYSEEEFEKLSSEDKKVITHYGYFHRKNKVWHLAADDSRYVNHSKNPTSVVTKDGWGLQALTNIKKGEEITQNYLDFEEPHFLKERGIS